MSKSRSTDPTDELLVIGYGNTLRGDDGVGPKVAAAVDAARLAGVRALACHQLTPELAEPVSRAGMVVFVDAAISGQSELQMVEVKPAPTGRIMAHVSEPGALLAVAQDVFGRCPPACWLTIPIRNTDFGDELSPVAAAGMQRALEEIRALAAGRNRRG